MNVSAQEATDLTTSGKQSLSGKLHGAHGDWDIGTWINSQAKSTWSGRLDGGGKPSGRGTYTFADGSVYEGNCKNGEMYGFGKHMWSNCDSYEGMWGGGYEEGDGKFVYADGSVLEGTWVSGEFDKGTYQEQSIGKKYKAYCDWYEKDGNWINRDTKATWTDGLDGNGKPKLVRKVHYMSGDVYEGNCKDGEKDGYGRYLYVKNGGELRGKWENGKFVEGTYREQSRGARYKAYGDWYQKDGKWIDRETKSTYEGVLDDSGRPKRMALDTEQ
jgi:hypothetical protein